MSSFENKGQGTPVAAPVANTGTVTVTAMTMNDRNDAKPSKIPEGFCT
jgi:hypothetical protein